MKEKVLIAVIFLALLIMPLVFSAGVTTTSLTVNTEPNADLEIEVTNADNGNKVQSIKRNSGSSGILQTTIYSIGAEEVNLDVRVIKDFVQILSETFGPYSTNEAISIDAKQAQEEEPVTEPEPQAQEVVEEEKSKTTGKAIFGEEGVIKPKFLLYIALVAVIGAAGFFGFRIVKTRIAVPKNIVVRKQSDLVKEQKEALKATKEIGDKKLDELEKRMKEIQSDIYRIKNEDKIRAAEDKLRQDMERIERMRRGEE